MIRDPRLDDLDRRLRRLERLTWILLGLVVGSGLMQVPGLLG